MLPRQVLCCVCDATDRSKFVLNAVFCFVFLMQRIRRRSFGDQGVPCVQASEGTWTQINPSGENVTDECLQSEARRGAANARILLLGSEVRIQCRMTQSAFSFLFLQYHGGKSVSMWPWTLFQTTGLRGKKSRFQPRRSRAVTVEPCTPIILCTPLASTEPAVKLKWRTPQVARKNKSF